MSTPETNNSLLKNKWFRSFTGFAVLAILVLLLLPVASKYYLTKWLLENGADTVTIDKVRINPFRGTASLVGAEIGHNGKPVFSGSTISINFGLTALFSKEGRLEKTLLENVVIDVELSDDGHLRIGSHTVTPPTPGADPAPTVTTDGTPWIFRAMDVEIKRTIFNYQQPNLKATLVVDQAKLVKFNTDPNDHTGSLDLIGSINGAPVTLHLSKLQVVPNLLLDGQLNITDLQLQDLEKLLQKWFQPFTGTVATAGNVHLAMESSGNIQAAYNGSLQLDKAAIGGKDWETNGETLGWNGTINYAQGDDEQPSSSISTDGILTSEGLTINMNQQLQFTQQHFELRGKTDVALAGDVHINYDGSLSLENNQLTVKDRSTGSGVLHWQGKAGYALAEDRRQEVKLQGTLEGKQLTAEIADKNLSLAQENLSVSVNGSLNLAQSASFIGKADLEANQFVLTRDNLPVLTLKQSRIVDVKDNKKGGLSIGTVILEELTIPETDEQSIKVQVPTITLTDVISPDFLTATIALLEVRQPLVENTQENNLLVALNQASARSIAVDQQSRINIAEFQVQDGRFLETDEKQKPLATLTGAKASQISWSTDDGLACNTLSIDGIYADISKDNTTGNLEEEQETATEEKIKSTPPKIKINQVAVGGKSGFRYTDQRVEPNVEAVFVLESLKIKNIDSSKQDQPLSYQLTGKLNKYAPLDISGTARPFAESLQVDQKLKLRNFPAQDISPYLTAAIGYILESGQLRLTSTLAVNGEEIDVGNTLKIEDLQTKAVNNQLAEELNNQLPVPLDTALYLLRDRNGDIEIDIPIQGKLSDINVGITDILITALSKAITVTVTPYLAYSFLGPGGALAYLGMQAGQALIDSGFPKLEFESGISTLNQEQQATLASIGKNIRENKKDYSICAKVSIWEGAEDLKKSTEIQQELLENETVREKLFTLGEERANNVKNFLVSSAQVDANRLLICNPGINFDKDGKGTVELKQ